MTGLPNGSYHSLPHVLGLGFEAEFRLDDGRLDVVWSPRLPDPATIRALMPKYVAARNLWLGHLAAEMGVNIAVVDAGDAA